LSWDSRSIEYEVPGLENIEWGGIDGLQHEVRGGDGGRTQVGKGDFVKIRGRIS